MSLSTVFHSTNSPDNSPLSHSVLPGLIYALLVLSTMYLFMKVSFSPDVIFCGRQGLKHQLTHTLYLQQTNKQKSPDVILWRLTGPSNVKTDLSTIHLPHLRLYDSFCFCCIVLIGTKHEGSHGTPTTFLLLLHICKTFSSPHTVCTAR